MNLLPKNQSFFDEFDRHTALIVSAAEALATMAAGNAGSASDQARHIKDLEEQGDEIVHRVVVDLRRTFITPLDRDDTHHLISRLDEVLDQIEASSYRLALYRLPVPDKNVTALVDTVCRSAAVTQEAVAKLRDKSGHDRALELCVEINKLENEGDVHLRRALGEIFSGDAEAIKVMKWKEVFETLEDTTDRFEDVADSIENLLLDS